MADTDFASAITGRPDLDTNSQIILIAIGLAESVEGTQVLGDYVGQPGVDLPLDADQHCFETNGPAGTECYTSLGPWQINMAWNWAVVSQFAGSSDPNQVAYWLLDWNNNAEIADLIFRNQGFTAWSTFNDGAYQAYLGRAQAALAAVGALAPSPATPGPPQGVIGSSGQYVGVPVPQPDLGMPGSDWSPAILTSAEKVQTIGATAKQFGAAFANFPQGVNING